jgi:hypothetical protein
VHGVVAPSLRSFYFRRGTHVRLWAPRIGRTAAIYKWYGNACFVGQAPLMIIWFLLIFFGARNDILALRLGYLVLGLSLGLVIAGWLLNRREAAARGATMR